MAVMCINVLSLSLGQLNNIYLIYIYIYIKCVFIPELYI